MTRRRLSPSVFLLAAALALAPWIAWLATSLPCHYQSQHWGIAWAGFDTGLALALGLTGLAALRRAAWVDRAAVATATLLIADAWFDIVTSRGAGAVTVAVAEALALELPIAAFCLWLARSTTSPRHTGGLAAPSEAGPNFNPKEQFTMNRLLQSQTSSDGYGTGTGGGYGYGYGS